jgi:CIC family chloride channel protein
MICPVTGWKKFLRWCNKTFSAFPFISLRIKLSWFYRAAERYNILFWAGVVGILGGLSSVFFRHALDILAEVFTGSHGDMVDVFALLPPVYRVILPAMGGVAAGLVIYAGSRLIAGRENTTDYMEAVVLGEGSLSFRMSLTKIFSSMFSISSGASIGREGPMVQLSSLIASLVGSLSKTDIILGLSDRLPGEKYRNPDGISPINKA